MQKPDSSILVILRCQAAPAGRRIGQMAAAVSDALLAERHPALLLSLSGAIAVLFCLQLFGASFILGSSAAWQYPRGIVGRGWLDLATSLSGYLYFLHDNWRLPLFHVSRLDAPGGIAIIFTDSLPAVALIGRLFYRFTGYELDLFGAWAALCFAANAVALTALTLQHGQRSVAAAVAASVMALCMPALLARWGHIALIAHFELLLALLFYRHCRYHCRPLSSGIQAMALCLLALWTQPYLFAMVSGVVLAAFTQAMLDRRLSVLHGCGVLFGLGAFLGSMMLVSGNFDPHVVPSAVGFGGFSANLLSPLVPQLSGLFPSVRNWLLDATGGQYEGFSYLGGGILLLVLAATPWLGAKLRRCSRPHVCLLVVLTGYVLFAASDEVHLGSWYLGNIPLPPAALYLAGIFRSSGRFIWLPLYLLTLLAIIGTLSLHKRTGVWLLAVAVTLQWLDTAPLRTAITASTARPAVAPLELPVWQAAIRRHSVVRVLPSFACLPSANPPSRSATIAVTIQLLAARADVATNTVFADRIAADCTQPDDADGLQAGELRVYLPEYGPVPQRDPASGASCAVSPRMTICSATLSSVELARLLAASLVEVQP